MKTLGDFLTGALSIPGTQGLTNRVPSLAGDFFTMEPIHHKRLSTNVATHDDCSFNGFTEANILTVDSTIIGEIVVGSQLFGADVLTATFIEDQLTTSTYLISKEQEVVLQKMSTGNRFELVPREVTIQVDIHGPASSENAVLTEGLFRSGWGLASFKESGFDIAPLYCSEPRQMEFHNAEQQIDKRWSIDCTMQVNPVISIPQQFADAAEVILIEVDSFTG
jgi:hypothetical protein